MLPIGLKESDSSFLLDMRSLVQSKTYITRHMEQPQQQLTRPSALVKYYIFTEIIFFFPQNRKTHHIKHGPL